MKKLIIIGNWKMNPATFSEAQALFNAVKKEAKKIENVDIVLAPPAIWLGQLKIGENDNLKLAAQNMGWEEKGAFTGEISPLMLEDAGVKYVILGHSERRKYFGETDELINKKINAAFKNSLIPILCIGETFEGWGAGKAHEEIKIQLETALVDISQAQIAKNGLIIAYEPSWAIGSGITPSYDQVLTESLLVKKTLANIYGREIAEGVAIIYGGSVDALNAKNFVVKGRMDGLLIGGASVKAMEFIGIIRQLSF